MNINAGIVSVFLPLFLSVSVRADTDPLAQTNYPQPIVVEAEHYASQHRDHNRHWQLIDKTSSEQGLQDPDPSHHEGASNGRYLEVLPDTRVDLRTPLIEGQNVSMMGGEIAILSYPIYFPEPGRYYVWVRGFSTDGQDSAIHLGLNGRWPLSLQRLQFCGKRNEWVWSSHQGDIKGACKENARIAFDIAHSGVHLVKVSMRDDGFEFDKLVLSQDPNYQPMGVGPEEVSPIKPELEKKKYLEGITSYYMQLYAINDFSFSEADPVVFYVDKALHALAIDTDRIEQRDRYAKAIYIVGNNTGLVDFILVTLSEKDGQSSYQVKLNNQVLAEFTNPETEISFQEVQFTIKGISLKEGDIITVLAKPNTNHKILSEEGDWHYSRGRWRALILQCADNKCKQPTG